MNQVTRLRARNTSDLIAVIPYMLGFHPSESVVLLVLDGSEIVLTARWDLQPAEHARELPHQVNALMGRHPTYAVGFVLFSTDRSVGMSVLQSLVSRCTRPAAFAVITDGERWWESGDHAGVGEPVPEGVPPIVASAVVNGLSAVKARGELAAALEPLRGADPEVVSARTAMRARLRRRRVAERELLLTELRLLEPVADQQAMAQAGLLVGTDRLWMHAWRGIRREGAAQQRRFWQAALRVTLPADAAQVLSLIGVAAWLQGEGVVTNLCLERALELNPKACGVQFLDMLLTTGIPPSDYETVFAELLDGGPDEHAYEVGEAHGQ